jgi:hypothetical protein
MVCNSAPWLISESMSAQYFFIFVRYECMEGAVVKPALDLSWKCVLQKSANMSTLLNYIMLNIKEVKNCI